MNIFIILRIKKKEKKKKDNKGIKEIKKFIRELYILNLEYNKKDE